MNRPAQFRRPLYVVWEVTHRCNARCAHCYSDAGPHAAPDELDTTEALDLIDQLAEMGVLILGFSGGEALARPDWPVLVERAIQRGLRVTIGTNGKLLTPTNVARLQALGVQNVTVSLDGSTAQLHDRFRGCPGLFETALEAMTGLVAAQIPVTVGFTPTAINYQDGRRVVELAAERGVRKANLSTYVPVGRGGLALALTDRQLQWVLSEWTAMQREYEGRMKILWHDCRVSMLVPPDQSRKYIGCGAGVVTCRITVNGKVTPCVSLPLAVGDVRELPLARIWQESELLARIRDRDNIVSGNCAACEYKRTCGGCRSVSLAYHGTPFGGDAYCWIRKDDAPRRTGISPAPEFDGGKADGASCEPLVPEA